MNFSFAGCGFLGIYHVGVASCLKQHVPHLIEKGTFSGASAGAIVACCLMCDCCLGECTSFTLRLATKARSHSLGPLHPSFNVARILHDALNQVLPENAHEIVSGRLNISLTRISDRQAVLVSEFHSKAELIQALLCSAHVPFYSGLIPPAFHGCRYIDGGLSDNLPIINDETITVSPFAGESDICPADDSSNFEHIILANTSMQCTARNLYRISRALFPPHPEILSDMCQQGFDDCLKFLQKNNLISCTRHLSVRSSIRPVKSCTEICSANTEGSEGEEGCIDSEDEALHDEGCKDCKKKVHGALTDTLHPRIVDAFQVACDSMNKGLQSYVQKSPALRVVTALATPWTLPVDIMYNYTMRILEYLPSMPQDLQMAYKESIHLLQLLAKRLYDHKRKYSARFTCQLAITEIKYDQFQQVPKPIKLSPFEPEVQEPIVRNLNIGFAVDFESKTENPFRSLKDFEDQVEHIDVNSIKLQSQKVRKKVLTNFDSEKVETESIPCYQIFDTFEQCLQVSNEMESIIAYHYKDENNTACYNFQEIFDIDQLDIEIPSPTEVPDKDLSWDSFLEYKPEIETEVEDFIQDMITLPSSNSAESHASTNLDGTPTTSSLLGSHTNRSSDESHADSNENPTSSNSAESHASTNLDGTPTTSSSLGSHTNPSSDESHADSNANENPTSSNIDESHIS